MSAEAIAALSYHNTKVGGQGVAASSPKGYADFQTTVAVMNQMEAEGFIEILSRDEVDMAGEKYVKQVLFKRLK